MTGTRHARLILMDRIPELSTTLEELRRGGQVIGLVPTMGALHGGHRLLVRRAVQECDRVVVTIFVNPLQFDDPQDMVAYPRSLQDDLAVCRDEGVALAFVPPIDEMYPQGTDAVRTTVSVADLGERWEGASRPGHFRGVATVVAKLFAACGRCRAYFGEKDFQQLAIVRRMAVDLSFPVEVVACPTVRARDGLALSSRNARLSPTERRAATVVPRALAAGREALKRGERDPAAIAEAMSAVVRAEPLVALDYAAVVDPKELFVPARVCERQPVRLLLAVKVGPVRLIDNAGVTAPAAEIARCGAGSVTVTERSGAGKGVEVACSAG